MFKEQDFTQEGILLKLKEFLGGNEAMLDREEIGILETYNKAFAKFINNKRVSLYMQRAVDPDSGIETLAQINLCNEFLKELLFGFEQKRKAYDEQSAKKEVK